jgi:hypothetical protein
MGFHTLPSMRLYWNSDQNFAFSRICDVMPLKRFLKIVRYIHLNDNQCTPKKGEAHYDKLYKVRPFLNYISRRFPLIFNPSRFLSIDESMIKFKGRSSLKQYIPMKPIKRGFKMWVIACATTGYCLGMSLYEGADQSRNKNILLGEFVVNKLSCGFEGFFYCLFFDNFFSSIPLAKSLLDKKFFSCATIRQTRKFFPKNLLKSDENMKVGDVDRCMSGTEVSISKWKNRGKKSVAVVSTMHNPCETTRNTRTQKDGSRPLVTCPIAEKDYNKYMGGVDHLDQLHAAYSTGWKSRSWWMRIFYYCVEACIVNSYIVYKTTFSERHPRRKPLSHLKFRSLLAAQLIGSFTSRLKTGPASQTGRARKRNCPNGHQTLQNAVRLTNLAQEDAALIIVPVRNSRDHKIIQCKKCNVALCLECFQPFHTS